MILDCTLRDGGYYLDWDFEENTVRKYLISIGIANVDIVEIGFRFFPKNRFLGAFAYCSDEFLNSLNLPSNIKVAVMINAADLISYPDGIEQAVLALFSEKNKSPVDIVRIAVHEKDITDSFIIAKNLSNLGYMVFINLMQVDKIDPAVLIEIGVEVKRRSPAERTLFCGYSNGLTGYVPTAEAFEAGGYETGATPFSADAARGMTEACVSVADRLWED